jgi:hypothetical protein
LAGVFAFFSLDALVSPTTLMRIDQLPIILKRIGLAAQLGRLELMYGLVLV